MGQRANLCMIMGNEGVKNGSNGGFWLRVEGKRSRATHSERVCVALLLFLCNIRREASLFILVGGDWTCIPINWINVLFVSVLLILILKKLKLNRTGSFKKIVIGLQVLKNCNRTGRVIMDFIASDHAVV